MKIGYFLSSEEFGPAELLAQARSAEEAGFHGLWISDHFHPWNDEQGHSPFVWSVIGGLSQVTSRMPITTAVTCPTVRIHPAVLAQATATTTAMLPGRFGFGVGSGEALNEQVLGDDWPEANVRLEMRPHLHAPGRAAAHTRVRLRAQVGRPRGAYRRRLRDHDA